MKKIIGATLVAMVLTSGAMADMYVKGGIAQSTVDYTTEASGVNYELGFGGVGHFDATGGLLVGAELNVDFQSHTTSNQTDVDLGVIGASAILGWTFFDDLNVYGTIGYYMGGANYTFSDGFSDAVTADGTRISVAADYTIWEHLSVGAEYSAADYTLEGSNGISYDNRTYTNLGANIKIRF